MELERNIKLFGKWSYEPDDIAVCQNIDRIILIKAVAFWSTKISGFYIKYYNDLYTVNRFRY